MRISKGSDSFKEGFKVRVSNYIDGSNHMEGWMDFLLLSSFSNQVVCTKKNIAGHEIILINSTLCMRFGISKSGT